MLPEPVPAGHDGTGYSERQHGGEDYDGKRACH
jgi:hypothetical protein